MSRRTLGTFALLALALPATPEGFSIGVKAGGIVNADVVGDAKPESPFYIVGPAVEFGLPWRFSLEMDGLYHRFGFTSNPIASGYARVRANAWEVPLLLKVRAPLGFFASGGVAGRGFTGEREQTATFVPGNFSGPPVTIRSANLKFNRDSFVGVVVAGGVDFDAGILRIAPEIRYTRWLSTLNVTLSTGPSVSSSQNELSLLLGLSLHRRR